MNFCIFLNRIYESNNTITPTIPIPIAPAKRLFLKNHIGTSINTNIESMCVLQIINKTAQNSINIIAKRVALPKTTSEKKYITASIKP